MAHTYAKRVIVGSGHAAGTVGFCPARADMKPIPAPPIQPATAIGDGSLPMRHGGSRSETPGTAGIRDPERARDDLRTAGVPDVCGS
ncbi:hypothetical protein A3862_28115 [Methylobacterium sp. XJLW]|jgi:hypothetical protein|uniref:Protein of unassigned function n=1 Tax=Methylobacterium oryzae CBMB20 TaxID=693986 RepID=A0A089NPM8_9HYPH|nr:protein of unassigned function [Methylobacterium oryzae CBMB20]AWV18935.1 hypothetical protein A3862_28115 [Methylobacterium sp. XJLW]